MRFGLDQSTLSKINQTFINFPEVCQVKIFGSRAKGNYKPGSDIDLAIMNSPDLTFDKFNSLKASLDDLNTPYTFDICILEDLKNAEFIDHIERVGILFYSGEQKP